ncbi:SH3 domain-containing protein [Celeribacter marinus]|uniref:SH3 domain-containing protein n=1 Tax=Celeribacter marinus TaxID=1397108 RepID=UPI003F6AB2F7
MIRLTAWTLAGLFAVLYIFGGDLSDAEIAERDARHANRTPIMAMVQNAFDDHSKRKGDYVPTLAQIESGHQSLAAPDIKVASLHTSVSKPDRPSFSQVSYTQEPRANLITSASHVTTSASEPERLASLVAPAGDVTNMMLGVVTGKRVNVRSGPSTSNEVLGQVVQADIVRVIPSPHNGWVKISVEGEGVEGYMSARFIDAIEQ